MQEGWCSAETIVEEGAGLARSRCGTPDASDRRERRHMRRILVGVDGTAESQRAAHLAANMAQAEGKGLVLACVLPGAADAGTFTPEYARWQRELAQRREQQLTETATREARAEVAVQTLLIDGIDPAAALAKAARDDDDIELIVIGHRDRNTLARAVLGSVADRLVQICDKPVLVVH
jgi:nucleotide-binding universal stress UspA family protein